MLAFREEGYVRSDYCQACWTAGIETASPHSTWEGVFRAPPPQPEEALKRETAETLLRRLMEQDDKSQLNLIYILAVMLERKRLLSEIDVRIREDGGMVRIYEHRKTGETFMIPDPRLDLRRLEEVQREVVERLAGHARADTRPERPAPEPECSTSA